MDKIIIGKLKFAGKHGCFAAERNEDRLFAISLELGLDLSKSAKTDNLEDTVDYPAAMAIAEGVIKGESVKLIEKLADRLCERLFCRFSNLKEVGVCVEKCGVDVGFDFESISVKINRKREDYV